MRVPIQLVRRAQDNYRDYSPLEMCILDEVYQDNVITVTRYDEEHVILQVVVCDKGSNLLKYRILSNDQFLQIDDSIKI